MPVNHIDKKRLRFRDEWLAAKILRNLTAPGPSNYPTKVARYMGMSRQAVSKYGDKFVRMGYAKKIPFGLAVSYEITELGNDFLSRSERGEPQQELGYMRLHHFGLKFPVLEGPKTAVDWHKVEGINNWGKFVGTERGTRVELIEGKEPKLIVWAETLTGPDTEIEEMILDATVACVKVSNFVANKYGMRLGDPKMVPKPHYAFPSRDADQLARKVQVTTPIGALDESERYGEDEVWKARIARARVEMPLTLERVEREVEAMKQGQLTVEQLVKSMADLIPYMAKMLGLIAEQYEEQKPKEPPEYRG